MKRPFPPQAILETFVPVFTAAPEVAQWANETFIDETSILPNPDHEHLRGINVGFCWTNVENIKRQRLILGTAQLLPPTGDKWSAGRAECQLLSMFGEMPEALIILYAPVAATMDDWQFMALVEHELYHIAGKVDRFGAPAFDRDTGKRALEMRGHDVEEFVGVVKRYGATSPDLQDMVRAVNKGAELSQTNIARACGVCLRIVKG